MAQTITQGKGIKDAATQGKITAQNPSNQSEEKKVLDIFSSQELDDIAEYIEYVNPLIKARFVKDYFIRLDKILPGIRTSPDTKGFIRMGYAILASGIPYLQKKED